MYSLTESQTRPSIVDAVMLRRGEVEMVSVIGPRSCVKLCEAASEREWLGFEWSGYTPG